MSALDGWIDVCRAGTWRAESGRDVTLTTTDLDELVATFDAGDPVPVVIGHPDTAAPAYAWLARVRRAGDRLQTRLRDVADPFRAAVEAGRYAARSIAFARDAAGRRRLLHLGFLGGHAPAVPGLAPTQFAAAPEEVVTFGAARWGWEALADVLRRVREHLIATTDVETADRVVPQYQIDVIAEVTEPEPMLAGATEETPQMSQSTDTDTDATREGARLAAEREALEAERVQFAAEQAEARAAHRRAEAEAAVEAHVAAGRVLPAEQAGLAALLASLPSGDDDVLTFAAPHGAGEARVPPARVLGDFLAALPARVDYAERSGGPAPAGAASTRRVAALARQRQAEARARGERLSAPDAVTAVRVELGLPA